ncbi:MAG: hypothetical protein M1819_003675 [Sarea resinae]|nr:MAG: hypothetical protein M1819_003675 [Sarea resinae]
MVDKHESFTRWAVDQGVKANGVAPALLPGRGVGIVAQRPIEEGEHLVFVPVKALLSINGVDKETKEALPDITVHGLLATYLTLQATGASKSTFRTEWRAVWPSRKDFRESMPFMWPASLQALLPPAAKDLLKKQQDKLEKDFATARKTYQHLEREDFVYHWLMANTRTFYYVAPGLRKKPPRPEDCMALCPFADYFNHTDSGCPVTFDNKGFTVTSDKKYEVGEEVYVSYGNHSNDFLMVEYGFILTRNKWDELRLDDLVMEKLSERQKTRLRDAGFLGNYVLDQDQVCYRTQVALRSLILPEAKWHRFINGEYDGEREQDEVDEHIVRLLQRYQSQASYAITELESDGGPSPAAKTLRTRWSQIRDMLSNTIQRIEQTN